MAKLRMLPIFVRVVNFDIFSQVINLVSLLWSATFGNLCFLTQKIIYHCQLFTFIYIVCSMHKERKSEP